MTEHIDPIEAARSNLLAAVQTLQQCTKTAANVIPLADTNNVIMVGSPEWIAKNVPGVEAMAGAPEQLCNLADQVRTAMQRAYDLGQKYWQQADSEYESNHKKADVTAGRFMEARDDICAAITRLAATTQASTAQAEREILLRAALDAADKWANTEHCHARDIGRGGRGDEKAVVRTENAARKAIIALAAASSTDAQAAAEVRDAARYRWWRKFFDGECELPDDMKEARTSDELDAAIDRALRAGDTGGAR